MSDMSSMNRENKKKQLRKRLITTQTSDRQNGREQEIYDKEEGSSQDIVRKAHRRTIKRRLILFLILAFCLAAGAFAGIRYMKFHSYVQYQIAWEKKMDEGSFVKYENFGSNVLKYSKDGASYIDAQGKTVWMQSFEMKNPIASVNGDFVAIADQQGNSIYICDKSGTQGVATTLLPILKVSVSAHGVAAAILEDTRANYISLYRKDGNSLDVTIKGVLDGKIGYIMDFSLSPSGRQMISSYLRLSEGKLAGRVAIHDFSEIGKNTPTRVVGGYDEDFVNNIVPRVAFLTNVYSCAFADNSISFFSSENLAFPELTKQQQVTEKIESVFYSDKYVGIIVNNNNGENPYRMDVYQMDGTDVFKKEFDYDYRYVDVDGDEILLYNEDSCRVFNMSGTEKFASDFDFTISKMRKGKSVNSYILMGPKVMKEIKLQ